MLGGEFQFQNEGYVRGFDDSPSDLCRKGQKGS